MRTAVALLNYNGLHWLKAFLPLVAARSAGADVVVIVTEWDAFRALDLKRVKELANAPVMVDLRNIYTPEDMRTAGFTYVSVGRS
jgi:UDPglucose 6-dehydrogenase